LVIGGVFLWRVVVVDSGHPGCACLWSNLYGGKLADKGHGVEPLTHIRPIYCVQAVCLCLLAFASLLAVGITTLLRPYVER
jgi:hypothetical protein